MPRQLGSRLGELALAAERSAAGRHSHPVAREGLVFFNCGQRKSVKNSCCRFAGSSKRRSRSGGAFAAALELAGSGSVVLSVGSILPEGSRASNSHGRPDGGSRGAAKTSR